MQTKKISGRKQIKKEVQCSEVAGRTMKNRLDSIGLTHVINLSIVPRIPFWCNDGYTLFHILFQKIRWSTDQFFLQQKNTYHIFEKNTHETPPGNILENTHEKPPPREVFFWFSYWAKLDFLEISVTAGQVILASSLKLDIWTKKMTTWATWMKENP